MNNHNKIKNKIILITGGTGSFGNRVARFLASFEPKEIRIYSRDEKKQWEMKANFPNYKYFIGDTRDDRRLLEVCRGVDYIFHAAALKQVPSCEEYPHEAFKTNVMGSLNVCNVAEECGVKCVVALSTDKAVKPINAMGISKAMMEKVVCARNSSSFKTIFCCVRYGNVMGSRGSVIPLFMRQIKQNQPLTLTVPRMTRFLMTLDESVDLVIKAMTSAKGGEVFVRKAPACTVEDLAKAVRSRFSPKKSRHEIKVLGIRPGEKIHEVLVSEYEMLRATEEDRYFIIHPEYREIISKKHTKQFELGLEYTSENTIQLVHKSEIIKKLDQMGQLEGLQ